MVYSCKRAQDRSATYSKLIEVNLSIAIFVSLLHEFGHLGSCPAK